MLLAATLAQAQLLTPVWVELGEGGRASARVVVVAVEDCPSIQVDGSNRAMKPRLPVPLGFRPVCEFPLPSGVRTARVKGQALALPRPNPPRVVLFGDTGCRIQAKRVQNCNDPAQWPFEWIAEAAAAARPNLVLHAGDFVYRELECPSASQTQCGGSGFGDKWDGWNTDFFKPAAKLLGAAPWVFVRGNHETCDKYWRGWFYYFDSHPWSGVCQDTLRPYLVQLGQFQVIAFDTAATVETEMIPELVTAYTAELASLHATHAWLMDHHPLWGLRPDVPLPGAQPVILQEAWEKAAPRGIDMVVSGHTHISEVVSFGPGRPVQIVSGTGGALLSEPIAGTIEGTMIRGMPVVSSRITRSAGFTLLTRSGTGSETNWDIAFKNPQGETLTACRIHGREASCDAAGAKPK